LEPNTGRLAFACAGHNRPLWLRAATGELCELTAPGIVLGAFEHSELQEREVHIEPGDLLVFYTDGVTEAIDAQGQFFDLDRLRDVLLAQHNASAQDVAQAISIALQSFAGSAPQHDDITFIVIKRSTEF
jgi:sigma-B regulation protein RsbU (phosphoserine phosphatase)